MKQAVFTALLLAFAEAVIAGVPLGHPGFKPSGERPIGWRGDWTGRFPGADPVIAWNIKKGINVLWRVPTSRFSNATPLVIGDKLIVGREGYLIICLDKMTGEPIWLSKWQDKPITDKLLWDVGPLYAGGYNGPSSPCAVYVGEGKDRKAYVLTGEGHMIDPGTGKMVMMSVGSRGPFSSPVPLGNRVIYNHGHYMHILEVLLKSPATPEVKTVWRANGSAAMAAGVVFYNGYIYTMSTGSKSHMSAHVYEGTNGRRIYTSGNLPHPPKGELFDYPSPVTSARHAFLFSDRYCAVLEQGPKPKLVAVNDLERMFAGVFLDGDRIYMRTYDSIVCIGPKGEEGAEYVKNAPRRTRLAELAMVASAGNTEGKQLKGFIGDIDIHAAATKSAGARKVLKAGLASLREKLGSKPPGIEEQDDDLGLDDLDL